MHSRVGLMYDPESGFVDGDYTELTVEEALRKFYR